MNRWFNVDKERIITLFLLCLLVFLSTSLLNITAAQTRQYHLGQEWVKIWINQNGSIDLFYNISITLDSGDNINFIKVAQPQGNLTISNATDQYGNFLSTSDASSGGDYKVQVNLNSPLTAGHTIWFTVTTNVVEMIYEDNQTNVGMLFRPTWWSEAIVSDLRVSMVLPAGVAQNQIATSVNWDNLLPENDRWAVFWDRTDLAPNQQYEFGVSFPKEYVQFYVGAGRVHNLNTGLNYMSIQEAIDANQTLDGHTILIDEGTYNENVIVDKSVSLIGENRERTIINGNQSAQDNFVFLVNRTCSVAVENLTIQNCKTGVFLLHSNESRISHNTFVNCTWEDVWVYYSHDNLIDGNLFNSSYMGVYIVGGWEEEGSSGNNTILANIFDGNTEAAVAITSNTHDYIMFNSISQNQIGIALYAAAHNNSIIANTLQDNIIDISFSDSPSPGSHNNTFYHNNFLSNIGNLSNSVADNIWDNGLEGNYWSDYNGTDSNQDGIGDTLYVIDTNNTDHYPLMGTFQSFNVSTWSHPNDGFEEVNVVSNFTISDFGLHEWLTTPNQYLQAGQIFLSLTPVQGQNMTAGFCRITLPNNILNASNYTVLIDLTPINASKLAISNDTQTTLYFTFNSSALDGIMIVPEFPLFSVLPLFMIATLIAIIILTRKRAKLNRTISVF